jgi:hypothetical protein
MARDEEILVLSQIEEDYASKTVLNKKLERHVDAILDGLLEQRLIEGISLSGSEPDHFRLTEKGRRYIEKRDVRQRRKP